MKGQEVPSRKSIVKGTYFSNWADIFGYPLAYTFVPFLARFKFITPNVVTLFSFFLFAFGCISLFWSYPFHLVIAAFSIFFGYIGDDIDGQLARYAKLSSRIGDYTDKVLDVLKIFIITASLSYAVYLQTNNIYHIYLGFAACFFFNYRYYIKLETMFSQISNDPSYLDKSSQKRSELEEKIEKMDTTYGSSLLGKLYLVWFHNRTLFLVDEAEFAVITSLGALTGRLDIALYLITAGQIIIAFYRIFERLIQINTRSQRLLWPLRK